MTVKRSRDGGATFPDATVVYEGPSSYPLRLHNAYMEQLCVEFVCKYLCRYYICIVRRRYSSLTALHGAQELGLLFEHSSAAALQGTDPSVDALSFARVPMGF